jgi:hypothetical protein
MTVLRFSGGETLRVGLQRERVQELLQRALAENSLLELEGPNGQVLVINPQQVQYLQDAGTVAVTHEANGSAIPAGS